MWAVNFLMPPPDATPEQQFSWRWRMAGTVMLLVGISAWGYATYARAADIKALEGKVQQQFSTLERKVDRGQLIAQYNALEQEIRRVSQEIFSIESRIAELGGRADRIYGERLSDLQENRESMQDRRRALLQENPWLTREAAF
jgi:chromosome segregation ATPase